MPKEPLGLYTHHTNEDISALLGRINGSSAHEGTVVCR
jgi:hypothetical protein